MRFLYRIYFQWQRLLRRFRAPVTLGTRTLVLREQHVLLLRMTYASGWYLPGGGVDRGESFETSAVRELEEETGVRALDIRLLGVYLNSRDRRIDHVAVYVVENFSGEPVVGDPREIAEVRFFHFENLPSDLKPGHRRRVEEFFNDTKPSSKW